MTRYRLVSLFLVVLVTATVFSQESISGSGNEFQIEETIDAIIIDDLEVEKEVELVKLRTIENEERELIDEVIEEEIEREELDDSKNGDDDIDEYEQKRKEDYDDYGIVDDGSNDGLDEYDDYPYADDNDDSDYEDDDEDYEVDDFDENAFDEDDYDEDEDDYEEEEDDDDYEDNYEDYSADMDKMELQETLNLVQKI